MRTLMLLLLAIVVGTPLAAEPAREAALRRHIAVLASDAYEGRKPGTPGGAKAEAYIAGQFRRAGLKPGARDGSWLQPVALIHRAPVGATGTVALRGHPALPLPAGLTLIGPAERATIAGARIVWAGYGLPDALQSGVDLTGAVLIVRPGSPKGAPPMSAAERRRLAAAAGAVAIVSVVDERVLATLAEGTDALVDDASPLVRGGISRSGFDALVRLGGGDPAKLFADADLARFRAVPLGPTLDAAIITDVRRSTANNVIGILRGKAAHGEAVAFTAHWDHLGFCRPVGAPDRICNGAVDNASGVATLIEVARGAAEAPRADRDMLFVATTAEEMGLLGAEAFATDPPRPLRDIVAGLNIDTIAITDAGQPVAIIGRGTTPSLDAVVDATAVSLGRKVDADTEANSLVMRQDGWALGKRGLPSVMIGGSFSDMGVLEHYLGGDYHSPTDDMAHLPPLGGAAEDVVLHVAVGRALADRTRYPTPAR